MARARNIKPGFFANDLLAECAPLARLLFAGLWGVADREGRLEDRPRRIKAQVLPFDDCDSDALLNQLAARGFILRYEVAGRCYIQVVNFAKHQSPHYKEPDSAIPAPEQPETSPGLAPDSPRTRPADSGFPLTDSLNLMPDPLITHTQPEPRAPARVAAPPGAGVCAPDAGKHLLGEDGDGEGSDAAQVRASAIPLPPQTAEPPTGPGKSWERGRASQDQRNWFDAFRTAYPHGVDPDCFGLFKAACPDAATFEAIMAGLDAWKKSDQWEERGRIEGAEKFLRKEMWTKVPVQRISRNERAARHYVPGMGLGGQEGGPLPIEARFTASPDPAKIRALRLADSTGDGGRAAGT